MTIADRGHRVLIADDCPDAAEICAEVLKIKWPAAGPIELAFDGQEAVELALANRPDVAILDIEMPGISGIEAAIAIRQAYPVRPPLLIGASASLERVRQAAREVALDHVFARPIDFGALVKILDRL